MNSPLKKLHAVPAVNETSSEYEDLQRQIEELKACKGKIPESVYISSLNSLQKQAKSLLGTDFRAEGIMLNVNPVEATVKDKNTRGGGVITGGGNKIKGGLVNLSPEKNSRYTGINKLYMNVETVLWIIRNGAAITDYLQQDHMEYRKIGQTSVEEGKLTAKDVFQ